MSCARTNTKECINLSPTIIFIGWINNIASHCAYDLDIIITEFFEASYKGVPSVKIFHEDKSALHITVDFMGCFFLVIWPIWAIHKALSVFRLFGAARLLCDFYSGALRSLNISVYFIAAGES